MDSLAIHQSCKLIISFTLAHCCLLVLTPGHFWSQNFISYHLQQDLPSALLLHIVQGHLAICDCRKGNFFFHFCFFESLVDWWCQGYHTLRGQAVTMKHQFKHIKHETFVYGHQKYLMSLHTTPTSCL